jgi:hypothetical protein
MAHVPAAPTRGATRLDPDQADTSAAHLAALAQQIHAGRTWHALAIDAGHLTASYRDTYRPLIAPLLQALVPPGPHGTAAQALTGRCYPDGRTCDLCQAVLDRRRPFDPATGVRTARYHRDLAQAIHDGHSWTRIATEVGYLPRAYQAHYRPKITGHILRLLERDFPESPIEHGTLAGVLEDRRRCYPDGRTCDVCLAARAAYTAKAKRTDRLPADRQTLRRIARQLHDGVTWRELADRRSRTVADLHQAWRAAVQPHVLELCEPLPSGREHGTRAAYVGDNCRCEPCTFANVNYQTQRERRARRGEVTLVDARPVREHLARLSAAGIGYKRAAELADVSLTSVAKIVGHHQTDTARVRPETARRILAITATLDNVADAAYIDAGPTQKLIEDLVTRGATRRWIASWIAGKPTNSLQIGRSQVTARSARAVRNLHRSVVRGDITVGQPLPAFLLAMGATPAPIAQQRAA